MLRGTTAIQEKIEGAREGEGVKGVALLLSPVLAVVVPVVLGELPLKQGKSRGLVSEAEKKIR